MFVLHNNGIVYCFNHALYIKRPTQDEALHGFMEETLFDVFLKRLLKVKSTLNRAPEKRATFPKSCESFLFVYVNETLMQRDSRHTLSRWISGLVLYFKAKLDFFCYPF